MQELSDKSFLVFYCLVVLIVPYQPTKNQTLFLWIAVQSLRGVYVAFSTTDKHAKEQFVAYFRFFKKLLFTLSAFTVDLIGGGPYV